jgi:hypothetical protein
MFGQSPRNNILVEPGADNTTRPARHARLLARGCRRTLPPSWEVRGSAESPNRPGTTGVPESAATVSGVHGPNVTLE